MLLSQRARRVVGPALMGSILWVAALQTAWAESMAAEPWMRLRQGLACVDGASPYCATLLAPESLMWCRYTAVVILLKMSNREPPANPESAADSFLEAAMEEARLGLRGGGIPIGSVLVHQGKILGRGHNRRVQKASAILHGEMDALENAGRLPASTYRECVLYTTLSPLYDVYGSDSAVRNTPRHRWRESYFHG